MAAEVARLEDLAREQDEVRQVRAHEVDRDKERPQPLPLRREIPAGAPFPVDALGAELKAVAVILNQSIQAPMAMCCQSLLAASNLAVQGHADVMIDGRRFPTSEFFLSIGESGERKTAVDRLALAPHREHERSLAARYAHDDEEYQKLKALYDKEWGDSLKKGKATDCQDALDALPERPQPPLQPILLTEEPTYEGLVKLLAVGQPSMGLFADEGGRLIGGYGMSAENQLKTAAGLSELWDGKRISRVRSGDSTLLMYGRRVCMHVMAQPLVARQLLGNKIMADQGLLSRFLLSWPVSTVGSRFYRAVDLGQDLTIQGYNEGMKRILETCPHLKEGTRNELEPRPLGLCATAKAIWIKAHDNFEHQLGPDGALGSIRGFGNKAAEHALRIAGTLCLVEDLDAGELAERHVEAGIAIVRYYLSEALRLHQAAADDPDLEMAEKVLAWARCIPGRRFHLAQVYQYGPAAVRDAKTARRILQVLEEHFYVFHVGRAEVDGRMRKDAWELAAVWP